MIKPSLLDELICHNASLDSVYHKPPTAFVEGKVGLKRVLPARADGAVGEEPASQPISGKILKKKSSRLSVFVQVSDLLSMDKGGAPP